MVIFAPTKIDDGESHIRYNRCSGNPSASYRGKSVKESGVSLRMTMERQKQSARACSRKLTVAAPSPTLKEASRYRATLLSKPFITTLIEVTGLNVRDK